MNEVILDFLFGSGEHQQAIAPLAIAGIAQGVSSLIGAFSAGKQQRQAKLAARQYESDLKRLEANRQAIIDPYANVQDLSGMIRNPYANLQVATQASQMQAEQTDIALASTLDTLRATGTGAGGATALAREAALSKQGISASIEAQEVQNARLRAQGEQQMQQARMSEAIRQQQADVSGQMFVYGQREQRELAQLERTSSLAEQYRAQEAQARSQKSQAIGSLVGVAASMGAQALSGGFSGSGSSGSSGSSGASGVSLGYSPSYQNALSSASTAFGGYPSLTDMQIPYSTQFGVNNFSNQHLDPFSAFKASSQILNTGKQS